MKHPRSQAHAAISLLPKDLPLRRSARLRERAESLVLLAGMVAFWAVVFALNFFVGQFSTPMLR